jgi:hypothetical protein
MASLASGHQSRFNATTKPHVGIGLRNIGQRTSSQMQRTAVVWPAIPAFQEVTTSDLTQNPKMKQSTGYLDYTDSMSFLCWIQLKLANLRIVSLRPDLALHHRLVGFAKATEAKGGPG